MNIKSESVRCSVVSNSLESHGLQLTRLLCPWNSPSKNTGMGGYSLLQSIFSTQGLNPSLSHFRQIVYHLSHQGIPIHEYIYRYRYIHFFRFFSVIDYYKILSIIFCAIQ